MANGLINQLPTTSLTRPFYNYKIKVPRVFVDYCFLHSFPQIECLNVAIDVKNIAKSQ